MKKFLSYAVAFMLVSLMALPAYALDTENPDDVENLEGTAYDGAVHLTWDEADDDTGIAGYVVAYGTTSVEEQDDSYDEEVDVGDVLEYVVSDLENDTTYYFSAYAYDEAGNESLNWALEAEVTPSEDAGEYLDDVAPQVSEAEALNQEEVKVVFSEPVELPDEDEVDEFLIEDQDTFELLEVFEAEMDEEDETEKTVILTTDIQEEGTEYLLTVGIGVADDSGNPIISGTSDTAVFTGNGDEKDSTELAIVDIAAVSNTSVTVEFNTGVVLGADPEANFVIYEEDDATSMLEVLAVDLGKNTENIDYASALLTTEEMDDASYVIVVSGLTDSEGNEIDAANGSGAFDGIAVDGDDDDDDNIDVDLEDLEADMEVNSAGDAFDVTLTWTLPEDADIAGQILTVDDGDEASYELGADVDEYLFEDLEAGEYTFAVVLVLADGTETEGMSVTLTLSDDDLSETGPGVVGLALASAGLGGLWRRRRKN